jgi:hypothetical protein
MSRADESADELEKRASQAEAALEEVIAERNRLWEELHRRKAEERELEHLRSAYHTLVSSKSWRLTAPLRSGGWFLRQVPEMRRRFRRFVSSRPSSR